MAQFDVDGALSSGYSIPEIAEFLTAKKWSPADVSKLIGKYRVNPAGVGPAVPITRAGAAAEPEQTQLPQMDLGAARPGLQKLSDIFSSAQQRLGVNTGPVIGGPVSDPVEQFLSGIPQFPRTTGEALLTAAALVPPGKYLKAAQAFVRGGTAMLEGGAPEALSIINAAGQKVKGFVAGKAERFYPAAENLARRAAELGIEDPDKAVAAAAKDLRWRQWEKPAAEQTFGELRPSRATDTALRRMQSTPGAIQQRIEQANALLSQPTQPWQPVDYGIFDRSLIKQAQGGFPGVPQTSFPRQVAARADMSFLDEIYQDAVNRDMIKRQVTRGLPLGGETFYPSMYPVKAEAISRGIPASVFDEWMQGVAPASAKNALYQENAIGNLLRGLNKSGIPLTEANTAQAVRDYQDLFKQRLPFMPVHREGISKVLEQGLMPRNVLLNQLTDYYKIPTYAMQKSGDFANSLVLDTHEAAGQTFATRYNPYFWGAGGFTANEYGPAERHMLNIAGELSLPGGTAQAGRWFGGGELTGLVSPRGDALDVLEKQAAYTLNQMGRPTDPVSVRNKVMELVQQGGLLAPWYRKTPMPDYRTRAPGTTTGF